ncbi:MAG: putative motility protein [Burkholderiaceae bacterium]
MSSDLTINAAISAVMAMQRVRSVNEAQLLMYRKALDLSAASVQSMIETLPQPALATSGTLGTRLNVYA